MISSVHARVAVDFEQDNLPIFERKCVKCHFEGNSKGGIGLDLDEVGREIGEGKVIVPGEPDKSDLSEGVSLPEDDGNVMPPQGKRRPSPGMNSRN